ncbi:Clathrin light chain [Carabus blaptoides fortunei]
MDAFNDNFDQPEVDPAAEFLAREQDDLAGLEDELKPAMSVPSAPFDGQPTLKVDSSGSFEMIDSLGQQDGFEPAKGSGSATPSPPPSRPIVKEEPEKIRKWREEQMTRLEEKDEDEEKKKDEWRDIAKKELEEWYKHHEEQIGKTKAANRNAEKQFVAEVDEIEPGTEWERIAKLCDFNPKASKTSKDVCRMRSIILQLKQSPIQPKKI